MEELIYELTSYGLGDASSRRGRSRGLMPYRTIAKRMDLTHAGVAVIERRALKKVHRALRLRGWL